MFELIPKTLEDTILTYLKYQEDFPEDYADFTCEVESLTAEEEVKNVLEELLLTINKRIACRDRYDNLKQWHHQYPLFDLANYIPHFCIGKYRWMTQYFIRNIWVKVKNEKKNKFVKCIFSI